MSDANNTIWLQASLTLLGGVLLFLLSQIIKIVSISPYQKYKEESQKTVSSLEYYSHYLTNIFNDEISEDEKAMLKKMKHELRLHGTNLNSKYYSIANVGLFARLKLIHNRQKQSELYAKLIYLSNSVLFKSSVSKENSPSVNNEIIKSIIQALSPGRPKAKWRVTKKLH